MHRATGTWPLGVLGLCLALETPHTRAAGPAGIKLDGTLGPSAAALTGPMYAITQNFGKLAGGNLYFSFQYFNVATGETALFSTTSAGINNVISRVTGGYASTIDGTIQLQAASGAPNLFLINPSGVTFTANAVIDVPASFYVSTANYLKFSDGNFYVDPTRMSTLSAAAPEAFGFLGTTRAPVNIQGATLSAGVNGAGDFQIAAGDVTIDGSGANAGITETTGAIEVTAVGSASGEVPLSGPFAATDGTVTLTNGALLWSQGLGTTAGAGIAVNAGSLLIDGEAASVVTGIYAGSTTGAPAPITVAIGNDAQIINGGAISSFNTYPGGAANVSLSAGSLTIDGGTASAFTGIESLAAGAGTGAPLQLTVTGATTITDDGVIFSEAESTGNAGEVVLSTGSLLIDGSNQSSFTGIQSFTAATGSGAPLQLTVAGATAISNGGLIYSGTNAAGSAGSIGLSTGSLLIDGGDEGIFTGIESLTQATGTGAPVQVSVAGATTIRDDGSIYSGAEAAGNAGNIVLSTGTLQIDGGNQSSFTGIESVAAGSGTGASVQVTATGASTISDGGAIYALAEAAGNGGNITLSSGALQLAASNDDVNTLIEALTMGSGNSGSVQVSASSLSMSAPASATLLPVQISTATAVGSSGSAGPVSLQVSGNVSLAGAVTINSSNDASGNTGQVNLQALGTLSMSDGAEVFTATYSGAGNGGNLGVTAGALDIASSSIANTTNITTLTDGQGNAGAMTIHAGSLSIDGAGSNLGFTGINSYSDGSGAGGAIQIDVTGAANMANGGIISSTAYAQGNGGILSLTAAALQIQGVAGAVTTDIASASYGSGDAGAIIIHSGSLSIDGAGSNLGFTGINSSSNAAGSGGAVQIDVTGTATIANGGQINSEANAQGNAGNIVMSAGSLLLQDSGNTSTTGIYAGTYGAGASGAVQVTADTLTMVGRASLSGSPVAIQSSTNADATGVAGNVNIDVSGNISLTGGSIASNTYSSAAGGQVTVNALGTVSLLAGGSLEAASTGGTGNGGSVNLTAAALDIALQGSSAETGVIASSSTGNAGDIQINVGSLSIEGGAGTGQADIDASTSGAGAGGQIRIDVTGAATLADSAQITAATFGSGNAGNIELTAGSLTLQANGNPNAHTAIAADTDGAGNAGSVQINAGTLTMTSVAPSAANQNQPVFISSDADPGSSGSAGNVTVDIAGNISMTGNAQIGSDTYSPGHAGRVTVNAGGSILLQDGSYFSSVSNTGSGNAGDISVSAAALDIEGQGSALTGISTESFSAGNSGNIKVQVGSLLLNGGGAGGTGTAIDSEVYPEGDNGIGGAGGSIIVQVSGNATLQNGAKISTTSYGSGPAGDLSLSAASLVLGGGDYRSIISSGARAGSAGQAGNVTIDVGSLEVLEDGSINIADNATVAYPDRIRPTRIAITAGQIDLDNGLITAASTGNIAASSIDINYGSALRMDPSTIETSSQDGNGGPITITGAGPLLISHSNITTSVLGTSNGNGGDITIDVPVIAIDTGAIQANTLAPLASGGTVIINAQALVPSYQSFVLGGSAIAFDPTSTGLNVVQAAAPDGVSGVLSVTVPTLDLGNALLGLTGRPAAPVTLGRDLCGSARGSSLAISGLGGVAPSAYDPLWIDPQQTWPQAVASSVSFTQAEEITPCR
jgi:filamentous hemagglutinin family protein